MTFEEALPLMKQGQWVKRESWPEYYPVQAVTVIDDDFQFKMGPLSESVYYWGFDDLLASDWVVPPVESEKVLEEPKKRQRRKKEEENDKSGAV